MTDKPTRKLDRTDYTVGWICALSIEMAASVGMLEEEHQDLDAAQGDRNMYTLGGISGHNIVMACLPSGNMGITPAATVAKDMLRSFPKIRFGLMVGIGGGAPAPRARPNEDIRLGDVVVSIPQGELGGVVKYDRGKVVAGGEFKHTGLLNMPPSLLTNAVAKLRAIHEKKRNAITRNITAMINKTLESEDANPDFADQYQFPGLEYDQLFDAEYEHNDLVEQAPDSQRDEKTFDDDSDEIPLPCPNCDKSRLVHRKSRKITDPVIHYGTIASADQVMRHGATRERIRKQYSVLCFEMEAAGLMNNFPCLVIRGICDYSDTHKHKIWQRYAATTAAAYAKELLGIVLKEEIEKTEEVVKVLERDKQQHDYEKVLSWLSINTHLGRYVDSYDRWHRGTAQKFLNSEEYLNWANENTETLWCPGIAGGGKTIFASVVVSNLKAEKPKVEVGIAYLFCEYARLKSETIQTLAAAILSQLADQCAVFPESVTALFKSHHANKMPLRFEEISSALISVLQTFKQVFLVIDALDECSEQTRRELLSYLLEQKNKTSMKLLVTSRPTIDFQQEFGDCEILEIRADEQDVKIVLDGLIERLPKFVRIDKGLRNRVKDDIAAAVDGMFVLVELFLDSLQGERSRGDLKKALTALMNSTDKVSTVYDRTLIRIGSQNEKDCDLAHRTLSWIVESKRPLTRQELQHALAVKPRSLSFQEDDIFDNLEEIVALCAGLVVINQRSNTVQLMHHTTRKYFEDEKHNPDWLATAHGMIASVCLTYVSFMAFGVGPCGDDQELESRLSEYPFLEYAAQHWGNHARDDHDQTQQVKELALKFLEDDTKVNSSNQVMGLPEQRYSGYSQRYTRYINGLQTGASFGLASIVQSLIENGADTKAEDEEGRTALHRGAENGHSAVVPILLRHGADVNAMDFKFGQTPLHLAALNGHKEVVQALLEGGAHADIKDDDEWMAIHVAAWTGKEEVVGLLLEKTDVNETGKGRLTALHCAAAQGHETIAHLLINKEADINAKDSRGWTPLHWASKKRHDVMNPRVLTIKDQPSKLLRQLVSQQKELQVLVQHQTMVVHDKVSAIKGKLANWHGKLAWLPSQIGLDVNGEYHDILTTLDLASNMQSFRLTLLSTSNKREEPPGPARLIFAIQDELTALRCVTECGHERVARLLLKNRAEIKENCDAKLEFDFIDVEPTALHLAAFSDHEVMARMLLNGGADVHARCKTKMLHGLTGELHTELNSLHFAIVSGNERVVQLLIERGADVHAIYRLRAHSRHFELPSLHLAVICGNVRMAQLLLTYRVDINARCQMNFDTGESDLEKGSYIQADLTPLHLATLLGRLSIVQLLLENHADVQMKVQISMGTLFLQLSALHIALMCNRKEIVHLLLQYGADVKNTVWISKYRKVRAEITVLHLITPFQDVEMVRLLIEKGADVNAKCQYNSDGWQPFQHTPEGETTGNAEATEKKTSEVTAEKEPGTISTLFNAFLGEEITDMPLNEKRAGTYKNRQKDSFKIHTEFTIVPLAAIYGKDEMLKVLLEHKADPNAKVVISIGNTYADITITPLHLAIICNNKNATQLLLDAGANIYVKLYINLGGCPHIEATTLQLALLFGNEEMAQLILENGTNDIHAEFKLTQFTLCANQIRLTALHLAVMNQNEKKVKLLLDHGASVQENFLLDIGEIHIQLKAIHLAAATGGLGMVQLLLDNGSDATEICQINNDSENIVTPLHLAAILNHDQVIPLLIKNQANVSVNCRIKLDPWLDIHLSALHLVAIWGNMDAMQLLLQEGTDAHMKGSLRCPQIDIELVDITVLHLAAMWGHQRGIEQFLEAKCDINVKFQITIRHWLHTELSVLHVAVLWNYEGIVQLLLEKEADVHSRIQIKGRHDEYAGLTSLHLAGMWNNESMAKRLLDHGADANSWCHISTPELNISLNSLHLASAWRNERMMYLLLSTTPLNERPSSFSRPPSSTYSRSEIRPRGRSQEIAENRSIKELKERTSRADPNAMLMLNVGNMLFELNAVHIAALTGSMQMTQLLCDHGADVNVLFEANSTNKHTEFTVLHLAVLMKSQEMVQYLLQNKADVHTKFRVVLGNLHAEFSMLHLAVLCRKSPGIPALLLGEKPDIQAKCRIGTYKKAQVELTLLHLVAVLGQDGIAGLLAKGVDVRTKIPVNVKVCVNLELTALELAKAFHNELLSLLLQEEDEQTRAKDRPHIHAKQLALLFVTVLGPEMLKKLSLMVMGNVDGAFTIGIEAKLDTALEIPVQADANTTFDINIEAELCLLHIATALGLVEIVRSLVGKGANLEAKCKVKIGDAIYAEFTALHLAAMLKHNEVAFLLLRMGADAQATSQVNIQRTLQTGLIAPYLTMFGQEGFLRFIKKETDIEVNIKAQLMSLHLAVLLGSDDVVWSLLYHGVDSNATCSVNIEAKTKFNSNTNIEARFTALHIAAGAGYERIVQLLIEKGANVDLAVQVEGMAVANRGAQIRRKFRAGGTALHMVAGLGSERIAQMLIDSGADINLKSQDGRTALKWARIREREEVAQLILERRAQLILERRAQAKKEGEKKSFHQQLHKIFSKDSPTTGSTPNIEEKEDIGSGSQDQGCESGPPKEEQHLKENVTPFLKRFVLKKAEERLNRMRRGLFTKLTPTSFVKTDDDLSSALDKDAEPQAQNKSSESLAVD